MASSTPSPDSTSSQTSASQETHQTKRSIVIYNTVTGFSRTYAHWISEALACPMIALSDVTPDILARADLIIYGAGVRMSIIRGFRAFRKMLKKAQINPQGKVIVWANGGTPQHPDRDWKPAAMTFTATELARGDYQYFYMEGGVRYEGLNRAEYTLLKIFAKRVQKHRNRGPWAEQVANNIETGYDHATREQAEPLIQCARSLLAQ